MFYRLLSVFGWIAHLPDIPLSVISIRGRAKSNLTAGGARLAGALVVIVILAIVGVVAWAVGNEAAANPNPTSYTATDLVTHPDVGGKTWATIHGYVAPSYVDFETKDGKYDHSTYVVGDLATADCILISADKPQAEMMKLVGSDGSVTLTGMLREDRDEIDRVKRTLGTNIEGLNISDRWVLMLDQRPANAGAMYATALIAGLVALPFLIGWLVGWLLGYVVFRPSKDMPAPSTPGLAGPVPVRVTGIIPGFVNGLRARELRGELRLGEPSPEAATAGAPPPIDLYWVRGKKLWAIRLTPGLSQGVTGTAYPVLGQRPAMRARFDKYRLILSFDNQQARDSAYEQLRASSWYATTAMAPIGAAPIAGAAPVLGGAEVAPPVSGAAAQSPQPPAAPGPPAPPAQPGPPPS
jgi:hypothetical protein